jgi:hypothetical protein
VVRSQAMESRFSEGPTGWVAGVVRHKGGMGRGSWAGREDASSFQAETASRTVSPFGSFASQVRGSVFPRILRRKLVGGVESTVPGGSRVSAGRGFRPGDVQEFPAEDSPRPPRFSKKPVNAVRVKARMRIDK